MTRWFTVAVCGLTLSAGLALSAKPNVGNRQRVLLPDDPRLAVNASKYPSPAGPATLIARTGGRGEIARSAARLPRRVERGPYERPPAEGGR